MIFVLTNTDPAFQSVTRIKVHGRVLEDQPCLAFASIEIGRFFLRVRGMDRETLCIAHIDDILEDAKVSSNFLVFTSEQQILESQADPEGYDYESLIQKHESCAR